METGNIPEKEFIIVILKMILDLKKKNGEDVRDVYQRPRRMKEQR